MINPNGNDITGNRSKASPITAMIQFNNKYYTISDNKLIEADLKVENSFYIQYIQNLDMDILKRYSPLKIILFSRAKRKDNSIVLHFNFNYAFILINLTNVNHINIKLDSAHKMLVSDDLKTWYNYHNADNYNSIYLETYDAGYLQHYINDKCKYVDYVNKNYNYILLKLNKGESVNRLLEIMYSHYRRMELDTNFKTGITNQVQIEVDCNTDELIVRKTKSVPKNIIIKDSLGDF